MQVLLTKTYGGALIPINQEEAEKLETVKAGQTVRANIIKFRNEKYFRRWFKLLRVGFDIWSETAPTRMHNGLAIAPRFRQFRRDVTILAGYFDVVYGLDGNELRLEAQSVAWDRMDENTFKKLYSATIDVLLQKVLRDTTCTAEQLDQWALQILDFDR